MSNNDIPTGDLFDVIRNEIVKEVKASAYTAQRTLELIHEEQEKLGMIAVTARCTDSSVRITEVLTAIPVVIHDRAEIQETAQNGPDAGSIFTEREKLELTALSLLPEGKYFTLGDTYQSVFYDITSTEAYEDGKPSAHPLSDAIATVLGQDLDLSGDQLAAFVGLTRQELSLARRFIAWENGQADSPVLPGGQALP